MTSQFPRIPLKLMGPDMLTLELTTGLHRFTANEREMITSAASLAAFAHQGQTRKYRDGIERTQYIEHPLRCALRIMRWPAPTAETITAALLHDVIEDGAAIVLTCLGTFADTTLVDHSEAAISELTREVIQASYGRRIADAVWVVTNAPGKQIDYAEKIAGIAAGTGGDGENSAVDALLVKLSDMCDNAGSLPHQYSYVANGFITKRAAKYRPALAVLIDGARAMSAAPAQQITLRAAADHAERILLNLDRLIQRIDQFDQKGDR